MSNKYSAHLNFINGRKEVLKHITKFKKGKKNLTFLDVGGRRGERKKLAKGCKYDILEIDKTQNHPDVIQGNICKCPQIPNESYDIVFSNDVFEHLKEPWKAANEMVRITKKGGINLHVTLFAWRYHPVPIDCFRYTHTGMKALFEQKKNMKELLTGYDIIETKRRSDGRGGNVSGGLDIPPIDELGGWREHWRVIYIGQKI